MYSCCISMARHFFLKGGGDSLPIGNPATVTVYPFSREVEVIAEQKGPNTARLKRNSGSRPAFNACTRNRVRTSWPAVDSFLSTKTNSTQGLRR